jgi:thiopeptide-type bacteriocin biosynthesis protein
MEAIAQGFFMLRRPMLPMETLFRFNGTVRDTPDRFEKELVKLFNQPLLLEALLTASPGLYDSFQAMKEGQKKNGREKLLMSLYKYLVRMCSRATPYGLFAGIASGRLSSNTTIKFKDDGTFIKHTRLDMTLLSEISSDFQEKEHIRNQILFFPNTSLYLLDDYYRYVERIYTNGSHRYVLSAVEANVYLEKILSTSIAGSRIQQMAESLVSDMPLEQAYSFVEALIDCQLLRSELDMNVTGPLYQGLLTDKLHALGAWSEAALLENIKELTGQQTGPEQLLMMRNLTATRFPELIKENLAQTDVQFETKSCQISQSCINILAREFEKVQRLLQRQVFNDLDSFKQEFFKRYENREVPLLTALDNESGIGFGALVPGDCDPLPLLEGLSFRQQKDRPSGIDPLENFKGRLVERALTGKTVCIELTEADFMNMQKKQPQHAGGFYWLGSMIADSQNAVDEGNFRFVLKAAGGPSGLELMGRFSHTDPQLNSDLKFAANQQQSQGHILAEIAHLPDPGTANILQRSHLSEYEIVFLCGSCLPKQQQIFPADLLVSVPDGKEIILRSLRLNKRVIPRMSTAHNFSNGLPLYRFLCELSCHQSGGLQGWDWGTYSNRSFLPRIQYKHWIISRASWGISKSNFREIFEKKSNFEAVWEPIRKKLELPRYVLLCQGDNELLIDCDNAISIALLKDAIRKQQNIRLTEFLEKPGQGILQHHGNFYTNELVLPFRTSASPIISARPVIPRAAGDHVTRDFAVGDVWLYTKIYSGTKSADHLLTSVIKPFCETLVLEGKIEKWFFIRYQDPLPHLRLRFYNGNEPGFWHKVLGSLSTVLNARIDGGMVTSLQTDTYQREIERYQGLEFEDTESIFHADSEAVLNILAILTPGDEQFRWQAGLAGADQLINDLGFSEGRRLDLIKEVYTQLLSEFPENDKLVVELNNQYRAFKSDIEFCLDRTPTGIFQNSAVSTILTIRSETISGILKKKNDVLTIDNGTASGFIHMFLNRLFSSRSREQELVIYHYLHKYYKSLTKSKQTIQNRPINPTHD